MGLAAHGCSQAIACHGCPAHCAGVLQLAVEATFLEAALQVVEPAADTLPDNQARAVEKLTFDWILNAEKYVGPQVPELFTARNKVGVFSFV